ncbi:dna ligase [Vairimorpha apis BRL 01]|uniref:DNA ligase n=1 Tax=Vairimorpha apis BRL 01 TaxID=1037528 RepID=T0L5W3_9MICR|nr:dna ligase [Vairimorpha apis BRL 01]
MEKIDNLSGRLEIQDVLTDYYKKVIEVDKQNLIYVIYLSTATIYPEYKNQQLNLGDKIIFDCLVECTGRKMSIIKSEYKKEGDFGIIGMKFRTTQLFISKKTLSVKDVIDGLRYIASISGIKSKTLKIRKMLEMISICSPIETKFLFRLFEEKLKVKFAFKTVLIALGKVFGNNYDDIIKEAYHKRPDIEQLVDYLIKKGIENLQFEFEIVPGIPLKPMLAQPSKNIACAFKRVENKKFTCENKYDGERIQIHRVNNVMKMYSRNLENSTNKFIDIDIKSKLNKDFVLDGEVVAYDFKTYKILPFQTLSTRKRKETSTINVSVCVFIFDILFFNGISLINKSLENRREVLYSEFEEIKGKFQFSEYINCSNIDEIEDFFTKSLTGNYEGIMIKTLDDSSKYLPSERSNSWIKLKKDYIDNVSDTFDLVVIGAYYGKGKRTGWYGGFLLASYDNENDVFETICKIGTGFDELTLGRLYEELNILSTMHPKNIKYKEQTIPDIWIKPHIVWEIKAAAVSPSPIYSCGIQNDSKGYSLRFPRFLRERNDKKCTDATSSKQITLIYNESIKN